jgi:chromosome segregation ATPase
MLKTENTLLQEQLGELQMDSEKLKTELGEVKDSLTKASESLRTYAADMNQALLTARTKTVIYAVLGFATGGLAGYLIGAF